MSFLSIVKEDLSRLEVWAMDVEGELVTIVKAIIAAEKQEITMQIFPLIKQAAINLQNESPGLDYKTFIPALIAAVVPIIPIAIADIEGTAISTFCSVIAGQLNVPNQPGNQGNVNG